MLFRNGKVMYLMLKGKILSPIITKKTKFYLKGYKVHIREPRRRYINKITVGKPMFPYSFVSYLGDIEISCKIKNKQAAKKNLTQVLSIESIGRFASEGFGRVQWLTGEIVETLPWKPPKRYPKLRIRKGLPHNLPPSIQTLLKYSLLHDFYHTSRHQSKIYQEPNLKDKEFVELLKQHHDRTENELIQKFQHYDQISAIITRKIYSPRTNRYNWSSTSIIDFQKITNEIKEVANNIWQLYEYIYQSKELDGLNESLQHGHTSLRKHLLMCANLIVQDFNKGKLKVLHTKTTDCRFFS